MLDGLFCRVLCDASLWVRRIPIHKGMRLNCARYDAGVLSGVNVMPQFQSFFGSTSIGGATGLNFSLYYAGNCTTIPGRATNWGQGAFVAVATGPFMADFRGRKFPLYVGGIFAFIGAVVQATSFGIEQFRGARFIIGYGSSLAFAYGPVYTLELAHPLWRGRLGGLLMVGLAMANTFSQWINFFCSWAPLDSSVAWRFPLSLQAVAPLFLLAALLFSPESPRWLIAHGRNDEALAIITKYHGNGQMAKVVELEFAELCQAISIQGVDKIWYDFRPLFTGRAAWYRMFCVLNYAILVNWSGNALSIYYLPVLVGQSGISNIHWVLLVTCCTGTGALGFAFLGTWLLERIGRKNCVLIGLSSMSVFISILAGLQSPGQGNISPAMSHAGIAFIMLFRFGYNMGITPGEQVYTLEMIPYEVRAKGWALASLVSTAVTFLSTYVSAIALGSLTWRFGPAFCII